MMKKGLAAVLVVGLAAGLFLYRARAQSGSAPHLHYKLPRAQLSLEVQIRLMEERVEKEHDGSGIDLAALGGLYVEAAKRYGSAKYWAKAAAAADRSLKALPASNPGAIHVQAQVALADHDFAKATALAEKLIASGRGEREGLTVRTTAELATGHLLDAERDADALVANRPTLGTMTERGLVMEAMGREDEAMEDWNAGLSVEDLGEMQASAWARTLIGRHYLRHGQLREARAWLTEALSLVPSQPVATGLMGDIAARQEQYDEASRRYQDALLASGDPSFLSKEARMRDLAGDRERAERLWKQAEDLLRLQLKDGQMGHRAELARILLMRGRAAEFPEALTLMQAEAANRRGADTLLLLGWALGANGQWEPARAAIHEALDSGVRNADLYARSAWVERGRNNPRRAALYLRLALALDSTNPEARALEARPGI